MIFSLFRIFLNNEKDFPEYFLLPLQHYINKNFLRFQQWVWNLIISSKLALEFKNNWTEFCLGSAINRWVCPGHDI